MVCCGVVGFGFGGLVRMCFGEVIFGGKGSSRENKQKDIKMREIVRVRPSMEQRE